MDLRATSKYQKVLLYPIFNSNIFNYIFVVVYVALTYDPHISRFSLDIVVSQLTQTVRK